MSEMAGNVRHGLNQDARFLVVQYSKSVAATKEEVQTVAFVRFLRHPFAFRGGSLTFVAPGEPIQRLAFHTAAYRQLATEILSPPSRHIFICI